LTQTNQWHKKDANHAFPTAIFKKKITREQYRKHVAQLYFVFKALEAVDIKYLSDPVYSQFSDRKLNRKRLLEQDLLFYYGEHWGEEVKPSPATKICCSY